MTSDDINFSLNGYKSFFECIQTKSKEGESRNVIYLIYISIDRTFTMKLSSESAF